MIESARQKVATTVNLAMVYTYFEIGRMIIEDEQQGKTRADYDATEYSLYLPDKQLLQQKLAE